MRVRNDGTLCVCVCEREREREMLLCDLEKNKKNCKM